MAGKKHGRAGDRSAARPIAEHDEARAGITAGSKSPEHRLEEDTQAMATFEMGALTHQAQTKTEGVTVIGEAVRRVSLDSAEFLIEITAGGATAAQALRDTHARTAQVAQALSALGVQQADLQTISLNLYNLYSPVMPALSGYAGAAQIGQAGFGSYAAGTSLQPEVQFGSYQARNAIRVTVRDPGRVGEIVDAAGRAGATVIGAFSFRATDEAGARRAALEAAARDARTKAEALAAAAGRQVGDPVAISEDIVASNGAYAAFRSAAPFAFGAGAPRVAGELEYYARVSANFRFQTAGGG